MVTPAASRCRSEHVSILEQLAAEAIRLGADDLEVDYKDGYERVFAVVGGIRYGIASVRSSTPEAGELRKDLYAMTKKRRPVTIDGSRYEIRTRLYASFGEDAFHVRLRQV